MLDYLKWYKITASGGYGYGTEQLTHIMKVVGGWIFKTSFEGSKNDVTYSLDVNQVFVPDALHTMETDIEKKVSVFKQN